MLISNLSMSKVRFYVNFGKKEDNQRQSLLWEKKLCEHKKSYRWKFCIGTFSNLVPFTTKHKCCVMDKLNDHWHVQLFSFNSISCSFSLSLSRLFLTLLYPVLYHVLNILRCYREEKKWKKSSRWETSGLDTDCRMVA